MKLSHFIIAALATFSVSTQAADSINLSTYSVSATYGLDILGGVGGAISGLEGSAITYARDRGTLFFVGDEGTGVIEISTTGQTISNNYFDWTGTGSTKHDTEGLTYLGNGQLVVGEERLQDAYSFSYVAGGTVALANNFVSISNTAVGNNGMEGLSYDPRNGSFVTIKQQSPQDILSGNLTFAAATGAPPVLTGDGSSPPGGGVSTMANLFNPALLGVTTLSDVQTLSPIDALIGTNAADNLLILSLGSKRLLEVDRLGNIKSSFDLTNVLIHNAIEGVTVDQFGTIYLVAEQVQDATAVLGDKSQLIVLRSTAPVPEPETYAMFLAGLGLMGAMSRRKNKQA
jgi:uncharacterized protein YjiK